MKRMVDIAHDLLKEYIKEDSICMDFTMGNGFDTLFLAKHAKKGIVHAYDIQQIALCKTQALLEKEEITNVILHQKDHSCFEEDLSFFHVGIFNFGYLPNGDKQIHTLLKSSQCAVEKALSCLAHKGILILVLYPGHEEGKREAIFFDAWCQDLSSSLYQVMKITMQNKANSPYLIAIEKKKTESSIS